MIKHLKVLHGKLEIIYVTVTLFVIFLSCVIFISSFVEMESMDLREILLHFYCECLRIRKAEEGLTDVFVS